MEREFDINIHAYVLKLISVKNSNSGDLELWKVLAVTHEQEIVCIEVYDRSFIITSTFPKESNFIFLDNLTYS